MVSGNQLASSRRTWVALGLVALFCAASGIKAQPPQQAAAPAADALMLSGDHFIVLYTIKPDKAADFESAWTTIKEKLTASDKADAKELGASIKILKVNAATPAGAPPAAQILYLFDLNPPSKTLSYDPVKIIYTTLSPPVATAGDKPPSWAFPDRAAADVVFNKIKDALAGGINIWPIAKVAG